MVEGRYFFPRATRFVAAKAQALDRRLRIEDMQGGLLAEVAATEVRVSPRVGRLPRKLELPDGAHFETADNDGVDALKRALGLRNPSRLLDGLERSRGWIAAAVVVAVVLSYAFVEKGIPAIALALAQATPPAVTVQISRQTLDLLDRAVLYSTRLKPADRRHAAELLARVAAHAPRGVGGYHLVLRRGGAIGANAFALPDGTIVLTDELWALSRNDEEIEGVFGHEMSHVDRLHQLQEVYQAAMIPAALAVITGDISQVSQLAAVLPGVVVESRHQRDFEQQADDDAAARLIAMHVRPSRLAELLERLEASHCGKPGCPSDWLGSHPDTASRAAKLRAETKAP